MTTSEEAAASREIFMAEIVRLRVGWRQGETRRHRVIGSLG
jgi:hypothetical protein